MFKIIWQLILSFYLTVALPLIYLLNLAIIILYPNEFNLSSLIIIIGFMFTLAGLLLWLISFIHLGSAFGVLPKKQPRVKKGIYKYLSHPMYLGIFFTFFGLSLLNQSIKGLMLTVFLLMPILIIRAIIEEHYLFK